MCLQFLIQEEFKDLYNSFLTLMAGCPFFFWSRCSTFILAISINILMNHANSFFLSYHLIDFLPWADSIAIFLITLLPWFSTHSFFLTSIISFSIVHYPGICHSIHQHLWILLCTQLSASLFIPLPRRSSRMPNTKTFCPLLLHSPIICPPHQSPSFAQPFSHLFRACWMPLEKNQGTTKSLQTLTFFSSAIFLSKLFDLSSLNDLFSYTLWQLIPEFDSVHIPFISLILKKSVPHLAPSSLHANKLSVL